MSKYLKATFQDVNLQEATTGFFIAADGDALTLLNQLKLISNAKIIRAELQTPIGLQTLTNNDPIAANLESCRSKMKIRMRGADAGSTARPFAFATISIPAPIGTIINGQTGDVTNSDIDALKSHVLSATGVTMSVVERIWYGRSR